MSNPKLLFLKLSLLEDRKAMTLPSLFLGILVSTLYGAIFHLIRGGGPTRLSLYLVLAWIGFWSGHWIANKFQWNYFNIGPLNFGMATLTSIVVLILGNWLSRVEVETKK